MLNLYVHAWSDGCMVVDDCMLDGNVHFIDGACLVDVCMLGAWVLIRGCIGG